MKRWDLQQLWDPEPDDGDRIPLSGVVLWRITIGFDPWASTLADIRSLPETT